MTTKETPAAPAMAELKRVLNAAGIEVNVHNAHGEWMEVYLPSGAVAAVEDSYAVNDRERELHDRITELRRAAS